MHEKDLLRRERDVCGRAGEVKWSGFIELCLLLLHSVVVVIQQ